MSFEARQLRVQLPCVDTRPVEQGASTGGITRRTWPGQVLSAAPLVTCDQPGRESFRLRGGSVAQPQLDVDQLPLLHRQLEAQLAPAAACAHTLRTSGRVGGVNGPRKQVGSVA